MLYEGVLAEVGCASEPTAGEAAGCHTRDSVLLAMLAGSRIFVPLPFHLHKFDYGINLC